MLTTSTPRYPIIAIVANPFFYCSETKQWTVDYVHPAYVRWLEASGGLIITIHTWDSEEKITEIMEKSNGIFFQGGSNDLDLSNEFVKKSTFVLNKAIEINNRGIYYPVWGTCQGFELLHMIISEDNDILTTTNAWSVCTPLIFDEQQIQEAEMFSLLDEKEIEGLRTRNTTAQFHNFGVSPEKYQTNDKLSRFFKITSYCEDRDGKVVIGTVEAFNYPIYAVQHHPEKTNYVRNRQSGVPQTDEAISIGQKMANFFIQECRKNSINCGEDYKKYDHIDTYESLPILKDDVYYHFFTRNSKVSLNNALAC